MICQPGYQCFSRSAPGAVLDLIFADARGMNMWTAWKENVLTETLNMMTAHPEAQGSFEMEEYRGNMIKLMTVTYAALAPRYGGLDDLEGWLAVPLFGL